MTERHDPIAPLRVPGFRYNVIGRFAAATGQMMFAATVFWQVFNISRDELNFVWVGLLQFVPTLVLGLFAGAVADRYDRRRISAISLCGAGLGVVVLSIIGFQKQKNESVKKVEKQMFQIQNHCWFNAHDLKNQIKKN